MLDVFNAASVFSDPDSKEVKKKREPPRFNPQIKP
jgi:hypothetical protein